MNNRSNIFSWIILKINCVNWRKLIIYYDSHMAMSRSMLLKIRNMSDKIWRENQNTHFVFINFYFAFFPENHIFYEIIWRNEMGSDTTHVRIWSVRIAWWVPKATKHTLRICNTYSFSTTIIFKKTHLNITLYLHCTSRYSSETWCTNLRSLI